MLESLKRRIPQARLEPTQVGELELLLLQADFPRGPLAPEVAAACWEHPPYWAFVWPGGGWLSQWLPALTLKGPVVDLGCGSGVLSIALARAGISSWAVDSDPEARAITALNARRNGVEFPVVESLEEITDECRLLVLADFLYDPTNLGQLRELQQRFDTVLLADCRLRQLPEGFCSLGMQTRRIVPDLDWGNEFEQIYAGYSPAGGWFESLLP